MAIAPRLEMRVGQSLVMTPQLQQAIKLLELSGVELAEFVEQELVENPLLQRESDDENGAQEDATAALAEDADDPGGEDIDGVGLDGPDALEAIDFSAAEDNIGSAEGALDVDYDNRWDQDGAADQINGEAQAFGDWGPGGGFNGSEFGLEQTLSGEISLRDHLLGLLQMDLTDPVDRVIGAHLVDMLDDSGYVSGDLNLVAEMLSCSPGRVESTLKKLQSLDPPGICARDLSECLALQLRDLDRLDPAMATLLDNLDLLAKHEFDKLGKICGVDAEDVADMISEIRALDPKPAQAFDHPVAQPIIPEVIMRPGPSGSWIIELNNDALPKVLVNNHYFARVRGKVRDKEEKQYLNERYQQANWLVKSLHQRANTILKVASEIVAQQAAFFAKGVEHLKPLILRDIAEEIEMHESTVSRVTSNKYMATPRGIYELKYFFTPAIAATGGGGVHSAESVRHRIKALIDNEEPGAILSDDKMVEMLNGEGIDIARRTVAKYRESMRIPSSVQRRREKALAISR